MSKLFLLYMLFVFVLAADKVWAGREVHCTVDMPKTIAEAFSLPEVYDGAYRIKIYTAGADNLVYTNLAGISNRVPVPLNPNQRIINTFINGDMAKEIHGYNGEYEYIAYQSDVGDSIGLAIWNFGFFDLKQSRTKKAGTYIRSVHCIISKYTREIPGAYEEISDGIVQFPYEAPVVASEFPSQEVMSKCEKIGITAASIAAAAVYGVPTMLGYICSP